MLEYLHREAKINSIMCSLQNGKEIVKFNEMLFFGSCKHEKGLYVLLSGCGLWLWILLNKF